MICGPKSPYTIYDHPHLDGVNRRPFFDNAPAKPLRVRDDGPRYMAPKRRGSRLGVLWALLLGMMGIRR